MMPKSIKRLVSGRSKLSLEEKVAEAKQGDEQLRNLLLEEYQPFIKKVISKVCRRYINETMDEFSVGLLAFNEAIDQYDTKQKSSFLTFANVVIRRRVIDHIRKEQRQTKNVILPFDQEDEEGNREENFVEQKASMDYYGQEKERENRVEEIKEYQKMLLTFDITFEVLIKQCPKHFDARENAKEIARIIAENEELSSYLLEKKRLPIRNLENLVKCSRKTIERNRKYIMAVALIYLGNYYSLQSYIH